MELRSQLHPLGLPARKRGGWLAQGYIAQAHILDGLELALNFGDMFEKFHRIIDRHIQDLSDVFLLVVDFQSFTIVSGAMANLTGNVDIRQEVHLNLDDAITATCLTAAALDIKGETTLLIAPNLGFIGLGKEVTDIIKDPRIGGWIGTGCPPDRTLVDINQAVQMLDTGFP